MVAKGSDAEEKEQSSQLDGEQEAPAPKRRGRPKKVEAEGDDASEAPAPKSPSKRTSSKAAKSAKGSSDSVEPEPDSAEQKADASAKSAKSAKATSKASSAKTDADASDKFEADEPKASDDADGKASRGAHRRTVKQKGRSQQASKSDHHQAQQKGHANARGNTYRNRRRDARQPKEYVPSVSKEELAEFKVPELREKAGELNIDASGMKKGDMVDAIYEALAIAEGFIEVEGILDIMQDGYGFLRTQGYLPGEKDVYVGMSTIRRNGLRKGDIVAGRTRPAREGEKFAAIQKVSTINGVLVDEMGHRPKFADLTPIFPDERLVMEHGKDTLTARVIDLASPIGKGQRGLIVSPPKAGKTTVLKDIAASIHSNNPEVHLICLLVDERPEEVTDMERSVHGEVIASTFDMPSENHIAVAELVIERAKRLVEQGEDVVILLDSITRLARAYNLAQPASGRVLSGGVDSTALYPPKRFLGAARNIEGGGSLTILASALIDTGSKMDEVIFEEFKGTGNMELKLDRNLADRRIFPAIDVVSSGTRKEELLLDPQEAPLIWAVRRILANANNPERSMDMLNKSLSKTETNQEFLVKTARRAKTSGRSDDGVEL